VYHTLLQQREDKGINDVAISRLEQISPFPYDLVCHQVMPSLALTNYITGHSAPGQVPQRWPSLVSGKFVK
jgi:2-oxoglutarate dehydrogenase complex dehydrogenase (E1) component-like enzyme